MAIDVWLASFLINRWIAVPLVAAIWALGRTDSLTDRDGIEAFAYACVYGTMGILMRIGIEELIPDSWRQRVTKGLRISKANS